MSHNPDNPDFSDVKSGSTTSVPAAPDVAGETPSGTTAESGKQTVRTYKVAGGDSLSTIARKFFGNANHWRVIYEANRDQISDPDLIQPGQVLKIPLTTGDNG